MYKGTRLFTRSLIAILLFLAPCPLLFAIDIPEEHILVFERSTNANYVCYDINLIDGKLNKEMPLKSYWVLGGGTRTENLTLFDRKMAFGVKVIGATDREAFVHLTAYKNLIIHICKRGGKWVGLVSHNGHVMVLTKMFAKMKPPMEMKCEYVDVYGKDITTGGMLCERIKN